MKLEKSIRQGNKNLHLFLKCRNSRQNQPSGSKRVGGIKVMSQCIKWRLKRDRYEWYCDCQNKNVGVKYWWIQTLRRWWHNHKNLEVACGTGHHGPALVKKTSNFSYNMMQVQKKCWIQLLMGIISTVSLIIIPELNSGKWIGKT